MRRNSNTIWHERFWNAVSYLFKTNEVELAVIDTGGAKRAVMDIVKVPSQGSMERFYAAASGDTYAIIATVGSSKATVGVVFGQDINVYINGVVVL